MEKKAALIIVDVQNDFCPGGALAVAGGDRVAVVLSDYGARFAAAGLPVFATRDWHPAKTSHFKVYGGIWPVHCVQNGFGAEFHPALRLPPGTVVVSKGCAVDVDSYSGFDGVDGSGASLAQLLRDNAVEELFIGGLATDYCVKQTVLDGLRQGFGVVLLLDAMRGVDLTAGDAARALDEMRHAGARELAAIDALRL